jgi:hypothetical protein
MNETKQNDIKPISQIFFKSFGFPIIWLSTYLMKIIFETCRAHEIRHLYYDTLLILFLYILRYDEYITVALKVETDISASIKANQKGRAMILMIMFVRTFKTDVIVFIGNKPHNICFHTDRYFPISESVRCYWQYHSVSSKEKCPIYRYIFIRNEINQIEKGKLSDWINMCTYDLLTEVNSL